ncbi:patatin-like phospholipase family protein [Ketobacter alkanivorans]|uniref:Esterase n=1 Tax=Ketobacter alkanivorans TaxID=1917421 RepID=A0A2K9LQS6_9GAMM|nr:patatin-like phospholipase family protein [Ketobacter alkanivorans]AUM14491.1 esterase [Ketobacter alkanivorans]
MRALIGLNSYRSIILQLLCVAASVWALPSYGQQPAASAEPGARPKICLVLSGGGARGAAHVGVLKVLEEYHVPIDCIVGTSMGSLVGAAYATGMTIQEMDVILGSITTELLFKEEPPRKELAMRRKLDDYSILFGPEVGVKSDGLALGKGAVSGVQLETVLRKLSKEKGYRNFDELPIQYRAVATDLVNGQAVVFSEGDLPSVMRASMSVPGAVAPSEYNGMMLVDGMLTSNLPVETARALGADIIIAVNVGTPLLKREELNGVVGVASQMLSILTEQNVQTSITSLQANDILISPDLGDFSTADFDHLPEIAPLGDIAARQMAPQLKQLAISAEDYAVWREGQKYNEMPSPEPVDEIRFIDLHRVNPASALAVMETKVGEPIDQEVLDRDMRRLYGTGDYEHVNYRYMHEGDKRILAVEAVEKLWGPDYLRFGLGLNNDFSGGAGYNLLVSYRRTWLNTLGAEWRTDVNFGETNSINTEFYQPLNTDGLFFVAPHLALQQSTRDLYQDSDRIAIYDLTSTLAGLDLGSHWYRYGELRLGVIVGEVHPDLDTGPPALVPTEESIQQGAYTMNLVLDQLDSVHFPRSGWRGVVQVFQSDTSLGADLDYTRWESNASVAYSLGEHTLNLSYSGGGNIGSDPLPYYDQFQWGGFLRQSGYATDQLLLEQLDYGRAMYYRRIMRGGIFEGAYGGFSLEIGKADMAEIAGGGDKWLRSGSIFVATDTPLGPVYLGYGLSEEGDSSAYFYLGLPY